MRQLDSILRIGICGGGIGGLSLARCLLHLFPAAATVGSPHRRRMVEIQVFEQSAELLPTAGGPLTLSAGVQVMRALGFGNRLLERSRPLLKSLLRTGSQVSGSNLGDLFGSLSHDSLIGSNPFLITMRPVLLELLAENLPVGILELGRRVVGLERHRDNPPSMQLRFSDGSISEPFDVVVGADGIKSVVRSVIHGKPVKPTYFGAASFGGITRFSSAQEFEACVPAEERYALVQYISQRASGNYGIILPCANNEVAWGFIERTASEHAGDWQHSGSRSHAEDILREWGDNSPLMSLLKRTDQRDLRHTGLYQAERLDQPWHGDGAVLIGDSAHAMVRIAKTCCDV